MKEYQYLAYDENTRLIKGTEKATSAEMATRMLASHGYKILSIKSVPGFLPRWQFFPTLTKISAQTIILFSRQLALLLESGTPMVNALGLLRDQATSRHFKGILTEVISDLRQGQRLSQAMGKHPDIFPKMFVQSVLVGEQSASLESVLVQLADYMEREATDTKEIKSAMRYPAILSFVAVAVVAVLAIFVLPAFANLYQDLGLQLPAVTMFVFNFITWFGTYGIYVVVLMILALLGLYVYGKTPEGKLFVDRMALRLPVIGRVIHLGELSRCCRSMAILHKSGMPISEIMALVTESSKNSITQQALTQVHQDVLKGQGISASMSKNELFLPMMVQMASVGEVTGTLDSTLTATARSYETEAADRMHAIIDLIQPVVTVVLAIVVALIASALISAMYSMYGQMG